MITLLNIGMGVLAAGFLGLWVYARERLARMDSTLRHKEELLGQQAQRLELFGQERVQWEQMNAGLKAQLAGVQAESEARLSQIQEHVRHLGSMREELSQQFEALSKKSLQSNNQAFLELAQYQLKAAQERQLEEQQRGSTAIKDMIAPLKEALEQVEGHVHALEKTRSGAYAGLTEQVRQLLDAQKALRDETGNLVQALRKPQVRGQWGELQLERVVELAGMLEHCDFSKQVTAQDENGLQRPDLLVRLPNGRNVIVDAKAPLQAYLDAAGLPEGPARTDFLKTHARHIRDHVTKLSSKAYWKQFSPTPEFVVLFIPGEVFFSAALEQDPGLLQFGIEAKVILATPTTLVALLKAVAYGWQQVTIAEQAQAISQLGHELYERLHVLGTHFATMGKQLDRTVDSYNKTLRCAQTRVFVSARKLKSFSLSNDEKFPEPALIEQKPFPGDFEGWQPENDEAVGPPAARDASLDPEIGVFSHACI